MNIIEMQYVSGIILRENENQIDDASTMVATNASFSVKFAKRTNL